MVYQYTLGKGGLGVVQLYHNDQGKEFAVKFMQCAWDSGHRERFIREIKLMAKLAHKNIIRLINYDYNREKPYYVMPYYKDGSLRDHLLKMRQNGKVLSPHAATSIMYVLADALAYSHGQGAIHRDLKPENILFNGRDPIIADWGLGKFIHKESKVLTGGGIGTPGYCAPEQWAGQNADARSDIYSLGLIYCELLTGSTTGYITDHRIRLIVTKMTMQNPRDRYQNMCEVLSAIRNLQVVDREDPMNAFWEGLKVAAIVTVTAIAVFGLLSLLISDDE